ncbi:hypothetical protein AGMMS49579_25220 [Spirochaetia bacterium]|nr:hypothetical protein AGMMS49579_25220 [Spirochaetia bacterium]
MKDGSQLLINDDLLYKIRFIDFTHFGMQMLDDNYQLIGREAIYHVRQWQDQVIKYNIKQQPIHKKTAEKEPFELVRV